MTSPPTITLTGRIQKITYYNRDNHFAIIRLRTDENESTITIKGTMPDPKAGESVRVSGVWENHFRYGQQFRFSHFTEALPATVAGIRGYLASGFIKGIGPRLVERIIDRFGAETLTVIETAPHRLTEVNGVGKKISDRIADAWQSHHVARQLVRFLEEIGVDTAHAARLLKTYGKHVIDILCGDPYRVVEDLPRIGFPIADAIARRADTPLDETDRAKACILHLLERAVDRGHAFMAQDRLLDRCGSEFHIDPETAAAALDHLVQGGELVVTKAGEESASPLVYPRMLHESELIIARRIGAMQTVTATISLPDQKWIRKEITKKLSISLSPSQQEILFQLLTHKVSIVTGGPGTGKTTLIRSINAVMERMGHRVALMAPTGRAARRLAEVARRQAVTLHKALGYNLSDGRFDRSEDSPLEADVVIVDEASMVDTMLMAQLLRAVPVSSIFILVGDVCQLPSVGPGSVLADMIRSQCIPTFELTQIFRQDEQSTIVINAHRVRNGAPPILVHPESSDEPSDFVFIEQPHPDRIVETIVDLCTREIPHRFRLDPIRDIQVLTPMHRGSVGTMNLNRRLQEAQNTCGTQVTVMGNRFKVGDKVMHLKNNYAKEVFNGDIGILYGVDPDHERAEVDFDGRIVGYDFIEMEELALAYAISVHKSQGSEYPAVVIPLVTQHYIMLQRNLLYTALTRGKKLVVMVGTTKALHIALENNRPLERRSMLSQRLNRQE